MSAQSPHTQSTQVDQEFDRAVLTTGKNEDIMSCSLVLSSVGITHLVKRTGEYHAVLVSEDDFQDASSQMTKYRRENRNWPPPSEKGSTSLEQFLQPPTLLLTGMLALFYSVTGPWAANSPWFADGGGNAEKILLNHEYYRLLTALTLHADAVHLMGNCLFGGFLFHFFCRLTGNGLGLFTMLLTAVLGNYINVLVHGSHHLFVGFSTAVFAMIGILAMLNKNSGSINKRYTQILPFMAGGALLAMIGSSGERTDLGAHFFGLCCGLVCGWFLSRPRILELRKSALLQGLLFVISCFSVFICWKKALL